MAGNEAEQDRTEQATPFKLREAKKRGQVAKSIELTGWLVMLAAVAVVYIFGDEVIRRELALASALFSQAGGIELNQHSSLRMFTELVFHVTSVFGFMIAAIVGAGLLANFLQTGPIFSWTPLKADFTRLNPATGFKKLFSIRIVYELIKVLIKFGLLVGVSILFFKSEFSSLVGLAQIDAPRHAVHILHHAIRFSLWLLAAFAATTMFDYAYTRWDYSKNMRMSRREQTDEVKRQEGDPKIKAKIRELQREAAKRGASLQRIPDADVVITNPTHLCVAIKYERGKMLAPQVIAKGAGELALQMRVKARQHSVPISENKPLARKLFERVKIDQPILPETYPQIAKILTAIYRARNPQAEPVC